MKKDLFLLILGPGIHKNVKFSSTRAQFNYFESVSNQLLRTSGGHVQLRFLCVVPLEYIEYEVYGDLTIIYPKPYSIY